MTIDLYEVLNSQAMLVLFLTLGFGYLIGLSSIRGFKLGATTGVLLIGLAFGNWGFKSLPHIQEFGFIFFMYSVAFQAGPQFFNVFARDGKRYILMAGIITLSSTGLVFVLSSLFKFQAGTPAGILAGALTSTPTLAAAQDAVKSGVVSIPESLKVADVINNIAVSYALTYIFGLIGLILLLHFLPLLFRINLQEDAKEIEKELGIGSKQEESLGDENMAMVLRGFEVKQEDFVGKSIRKLRLRGRTRCVLLLVKRDNQVMEVTGDTVLKMGDRIAMIGDPEYLEKAFHMIGPEIFDKDLISQSIDTCDIIVSQKDAVGKSLRQIKFDKFYGCFLSGITRAHIQLSANWEMKLQRGDILHFKGVRRHLKELSEKIGKIERDIYQTDLITFAFGIVGGLLLGEIVIKVGDISVGLGMAGGLLISGIFVGFMRSYHPTFGSMPHSVRWVFMELGLLLFMSSIGLTAGKGVVDTLLSGGPIIMLCGALVTIFPVVIGYLFGSHVLKLNSALLFGSISGSMTSTPSLTMITELAKSSVPSLGYAGTYTFANVFMTLAGTLVMGLLKYD